MKIRHFFTKSLLLSLCVSILFTSCSKNPVTGKTELTLISESQEIALGKENYLALQQASGGDYVTIPQVSDYVQNVGMKLAKVSDRPQLPYAFTVINNSIPNAWALPGGKIAINRGLLTELDNEAELAAVLSHEIVHSAARHSAQAIERNLAFQAGLIGLAVTLNDHKYDDLIIGASAAGVVLLGFQYSQHAELEADTYSMKYMSKAGYDLQGAVELQRTFLELSENKEPGWLAGLFSTHPPSKERLDKNIKNLKKYPSGGYLGQEAYQEAMKPLLDSQAAYDKLEEGFKALESNKLDKALALAHEALEIQPREGQIYGLMGKVYKKRQKYYKAIEAYDKAISLNDHFFDFYLQRGLLKQQVDDEKGAEADLEKSMELFPTSTAQLHLGELAVEDGDKQKALQYFHTAGKSDTVTGETARAWEAQLREPYADYQTVNVYPSLNPFGYLILTAVNRSTSTFENLQVSIIVIDQGSSDAGYLLTFPHAIPPNKASAIQTNIGPLQAETPLDDQLLIRIVSAEK
ncbi:MAG: M48 family metalloprotease [Chlamydiota bacterium]